MAVPDLLGFLLLSTSVAELAALSDPVVAGATEPPSDCWMRCADALSALGGLLLAVAFLGVCGVAKAAVELATRIL